MLTTGTGILADLREIVHEQIEFTRVASTEVTVR
jgi:hypothetical protein